MNLTTLLLVGLGGGLGAVARYAISYSMKQAGITGEFPLATLLINVSGSMLLGIFAALCHQERHTYWYLFLGTGLCGGFTTFSTFSLEVAAAIEKQHWGMAILYVFSSVIAAVLAFFIAVWMFSSR